MFQLAEIDPCQHHACPRPVGGARLAVLSALVVHGILVAALAAVHLLRPAPPDSGQGEVHATFAGEPGTQPPAQALPAFARKAPRLDPTGSDPQMIELPYTPTELSLPTVTTETGAPTSPPPAFNGEFIPVAETRKPGSAEKANRPSGRGTSPPPTTKKQGRPPAEVVPAQVRRTSRPHYPSSAMRTGAEGVAHIRLSLDASGEVTGANLARSSGHESLDQAALKAAARWRFTPASSGGTPIASVVVVPIRFSLQ